MAITVTSRPEKTIDGILSRWNASRTPLQYKFSSNLFPTNNVDPLKQTDSFAYDSAKRGVIVEAVAHGFTDAGQYCSVTSSNPSLATTTEQDVYGVYKIIEVIDANQFVIDLFISVSFTDEFYVQRYYKGYKGIIKVYAGAPEYHPYDADGSKPQREIGEIQVDFDANNEGICNVRNFVKPDMSADFDENDENSHDAWTSFFIEYTEIWDNQEFPIPYAVDLLANCTPFQGFTNESFDNGLTDWSQESIPSSTSWTAGTGEVLVSFSSPLNSSSIIYQAIDIRENIPYQVEVNYNLVSGTVSDNITLSVLARRVLDGVFETVYFEQNTQLGAGVGLIDFMPTKEYDAIGFRVNTFVSNPSAVSFSMQYLQVTTSVGDQCLYSSFANFGAKQFQDSLGGNFGDYLIDDTIKGKILTHFDTLKYPFLVNGIIPASTFYKSEGSDSVFLETFLFDKQGNEKEYIRQQVQSKSDGVYTIVPNITITNSEWVEGTTQFISIPSNLLLDADNGTFENNTPASWNILSLRSEATGVASSTTARTGSYSGDFGLSVNSAVSGELELYEFTTPISVINGSDYVAELYYRNDGNFIPQFSGKVNVYYKIKGTNIITNKILLDSNNVTDTWEALTVSFTADSDQVNLVMCIELLEEFTFGGASFLFDDISVKGPISYLSEKKPIKTGVGCGFKSFPIRWKNDLGGWEQWNFTRYGTFKENVSNKVNIKRDITENWDDNFINGSTQFDTISQTVRESITIRSELLTENEQKVLNQIRRSIRTQAFINSKWVTVTIKGGTYELYDENTKIREVSFDIDLPETLTQEQ